MTDSARYVIQAPLEPKEPWEEFVSVEDNTDNIFSNSFLGLRFIPGPEPYEKEEWLKELRAIAKKLGEKRLKEVELRKKVKEELEKELAEKEKAYLAAEEESINELLNRALEASA